MSLFIALLKCIFCVEDDEERQIRYRQQSSFSDTVKPLCSSQGAYHGCKFDTSSRLNFAQNTSKGRAYSISDSYPGPTKSANVLSKSVTGISSAPVQPSSAVSATYVPRLPSLPVSDKEYIAKKIDWKKIHGISIDSSISSSQVSNSYPSQTKSTIVLNGDVSKSSTPTQVSGKEVTNSGTYTPKQPSISISDKDSIAKIKSSTSSSPVSGNDNNVSVSSRFDLGSSHSVKPSPATSRYVLSLVSEKGSGTKQKVISALKGTNSNNNGRLSSDVNPAAPKQFQSCTMRPTSSQNLTPSSSTNESGKCASAGKTKHPFSSSSSFEKPQSSKGPKPPPLSTKQTISLASSRTSSPQSKNTYIWIEKEASSTYVFPKEIKSLIEKDIVPGVLKMPLSKSSYKDYFHALLYAEDCYLEKWDGFEMEEVKVELHPAAIYMRGKGRYKYEDNNDKDEKVFVAFELDVVREMRPFLISRDFVSLQPVNGKAKIFQGVIYRVVKSNIVLAEFGDDFHSCHHPGDEYDVKFTFNRVCLKRAHQAIAAASESLFRNFLFPGMTPKHELPFSELYSRHKPQQEDFAVRQILRLQGIPPFLVEGPLIKDKRSSITGVVIVKGILKILRSDPSKKILLCAPMNKTCDLLMRGLKKDISESDMFRANAAFREVDGVPLDILPSCLFKDEMGCFSCPSLEKLKKYKLISTTFMSSYRLYGEGITAGHFSHIFLVDASSATEPEAMVPLANFITNETIVVVTGAPGNHSGWIRSKIARENGLMTSYFERLRNSSVYEELDPKYIVQLEDAEKYRNVIW